MLDLSSLNDAQREAVETTEGPLLILAGAGSGKTRVLTYRIAYILDSGLAGPDNILAMTFTNKAAGEMKERIAELIASNFDADSTPAVPSWMGTFHSMGVRVLKVYGELVGLGPTFSIYDSSDQLQVIKEAMKNLNFSVKEFNPNAVKKYISSAKNQLIEPDNYSDFAQGYFQQTVAEIYFEYQKLLKESNSVDFDDLILLPIKLFEQNPQVLQKYQEQFKYILVDEYQDTNHAQYRLIKMLAKIHRNLCCVGDDDQSIYAFRGATIKNILNFESDYAECKVLKLEQNYRSTKKILEASYHVISRNRARKDKKLWTENSEGANIVLYTAADEKDEAEWVVNEIRERSNEESYKDFAILYRTNAQSRAIEEAFINNAVPYKIVGGVRFYERKEIKDVLAYLKIISNPSDKQSMERIINTPRRGIGGKSYADLVRLARASDMSLAAFLIQQRLEYPVPAIRNFGDLLFKIMNKSETLQLVELINYVLDESGYIKMLDDGTDENAARIENIKELITVASKFGDLEPKQALTSFLDEVSLLEGFALQEEERESVTLMTIHSAKGLEFPHVFIVGLEENLFPHSNTLFDDKELEEERRLAYVAITRAKQHLYITHAANRMYFGRISTNPISRFVEDIDQKLIEKKQSAILGQKRLDPYTKNYYNQFKEEEESYEFEKPDLSIGDKVKHEYFGVGKVKLIDDEIIEVDFGAAHGVKELMVEYARLTKL